jgi:hypothetical protein
MKPFLKTLAVSTVCLAMLGLSACEKVENAAAKGPAESAGAKLDAFAGKAAAELKVLGEKAKIDEFAGKAAVELNKLGEKAGQGLEKAGSSMQNAARDAQERGEQK